jgi:RimJ/RimL family protein N-acetyltransferase
MKSTQKSSLNEKVSRQTFKKNLVNFRFHRKDPFNYKSVNEAGQKIFFKVFKESAENPIRQFSRFKKYLGIIIKLTFKTYDIENWKIVLLNNKPIGIIMPHIFPENPELGTILNIGLIPNVRGKGYGRIIHAKGLELLKKMGAKKYMGSTDMNNHAMLRVFKSNGCRKCKPDALFVSHLK